MLPVPEKGPFWRDRKRCNLFGQVSKLGLSVHHEGSRKSRVVCVGAELHFCLHHLSTKPPSPAKNILMNSIAPWTPCRVKSPHTIPGPNGSFRWPCGLIAELEWVVATATSPIDESAAGQTVPEEPRFNFKSTSTPNNDFLGKMCPQRRYALSAQTGGVWECGLGYRKLFNKISVEKLLHSPRMVQLGLQIESEFACQ